MEPLDDAFILEKTSKSCNTGPAVSEWAGVMKIPWVCFVSAPAFLFLDNYLQIKLKTLKNKHEIVMEVLNAQQKVLSTLW